jgi:allantoinase
VPPRVTTVRAIRSERVLIDGAFRPATIVIDPSRGTIADVLPYGELANASSAEVDLETIADAILPGLVDTHVHMNEPGRTEWEGAETATRAAAAGGVTTLVDMPLNCIPVTTSRAALELKVDALRDHLAVDVGFWGGVVPGNAAELAPMALRGMLGAKCFLCHSGIDDFPRSTADDLRAAMPILRDAGTPLLVHAELELDAPPPSDPRSYATYLASRPRAWEDAAIAMVIDLCRETRCPVHVVHLSSATALPLIAAAKDEGLPFTVETCPHYLCLSSERIPDGATEYKCAPPIREEPNRELLWQGVESGVIDFVTSDHSPCTPALKKPEKGDFMGAWGGIASLQLGLSSVWTHASDRGIALTEVVARMTEHPARLAGLSRRKGRIARGFDADLCAFDPDARFVVAADALHFKHKVSPYLGRELRGRIASTWLRGERIFDRGSFVTEAIGRPILGRSMESA